METSEAAFRLAAAAHSDYVVERAEAALAACDAKVAKFGELLDGIRADRVACEATLDRARTEREHWKERAAEVPPELGGAVALGEPVSAQAGLAAGEATSRKES
jgi:hypothetical protein